MKLISLLTLVTGGLVAAPPAVAALSSGDAPAMYEAYNNAFLYTSGSTAYYKKSLGDPSEDGSWTDGLDIMVVLDAYENTGDGDKLALINDLLTTWLAYNPHHGMGMVGMMISAGIRWLLFVVISIVATQTSLIRPERDMTWRLRAAGIQHIMVVEFGNCNLKMTRLQQTNVCCQIIASGGSLV
jgi:hypothetical protein